MELFVIFVWAKVFAEIFEHLSLPAVLGEITAGALLGPNAIALVKPSEFTFSIAGVGAVFLLLSVGLETKPQELIRVGGKSLGVALGGVVLPFAAGFGYILGRGYSAHEATFVAAAMVATSVAVTARVLSDMGVLTSEPARIILGAAVFDDILGMLVLAVVAGLASSGSVRWLQLTILLIEAVGFAIFMIFVAPKLIHRIRERIEELAIADAPVFVAMGLGLGLSAVAEKIGLAAIIGAFFTGLAFAEYGTQWRIRERVEGLSEFLAPFFFFTIGSQLDVKALSSRSLIVTAGMTSLLAIITKLVGCGLPVLKDGSKVALQVGIGMIPRAEVGMIVAALGLQMGLLSHGGYAVVILMAMATTIVTPPLLRLQFRSVELPHSFQQKTGASFTRLFRPLLGLALCAVTACAAVVVFSEQANRTFVLAGFLLVVILVAKLWGRAAGMLGTLAGALIFATLLFHPLGSWAVQEDSARTSLGWMMLGGMALSYFLGRDKPKSVVSPKQ
jgi:Kef-type K+ transport system membrane component KefB